MGRCEESTLYTTTDISTITSYCTGKALGNQLVQPQQQSSMRLILSGPQWDHRASMVPNWTAIMPLSSVRKLWGFKISAEDCCSGGEAHGLLKTAENSKGFYY